MIAYIRFADRLSAWFGKAFAWCIMMMTLGVSYEVFVRYVFRAPTTWAFDVSFIMYGTLFMMGGAYTLSRDGHVRGDFIYRLWRPRTQATRRACALFPLLLSRHPGADLRRLEIRRPLLALSAKSASTAPPASRSTSSRRSSSPPASCSSCRASPRSCAASSACATGDWPPPRDDVEETEKLLMETSAKRSAQRRGVDVVADGTRASGA